MKHLIKKIPVLRSIARVVYLTFVAWRKSFPDVLPRGIKKTIYSGRNRYCPVCDSHVRTFQEIGVVLRPNARCPVCGSLERHRMDWLFLRKHTNLFDSSPKRMLHVAPEHELEHQFKNIRNLDYVSADLSSPRAMIRMDVTDIQYPDNSFDIVYCCHVLEHVPDDRKAMRELRRVLRPDGWAMLQVPITCETTFEDPTLTDPGERERLFGQSDHVRRYGCDYPDRLTSSGFAVRVYTPADILGHSSLTQMGLLADESVFFCRKRSG